MTALQGIGLCLGVASIVGWYLEAPGNRALLGRASARLAAIRAAFATVIRDEIHYRRTGLRRVRKDLHISWRVEALDSRLGALAWQRMQSEDRRRREHAPWVLAFAVAALVSLLLGSLA